MTDPNSLAIFAKVVEASSISEVARHLKMSISTVRRHIAGLENKFGVCLLERSTRNTGDRSLLRRADHQDPCHRRRHLSSVRLLL
jgi:DNA-binding transcriptional LysR family regulator